MEPQLQERLAVVVREGLKGNHVLFGEDDLAAAFGEDASDGGDALAVDAPVAQELGSAGLSLARAGSIEQARALIGGMSPPCRAALARLYLRFLARCAAARGNAN